jgi:hypothetical protein
MTITQAGLEQLAHDRGPGDAPLGREIVQSQEHLLANTHHEARHAGVRHRAYAQLPVPAVGTAGVVIGARLSRATLLRVEEERAAREQELQSAREERERAARRREARGVARALAVQFGTRKAMLTTSRDRREWWAAQLPIAVDLRAEDQHLLASWMSDYSWEIIALAMHLLFSPVVGGNPAGTGTRWPASVHK